MDAAAAAAAAVGAGQPRGPPAKVRFRRRVSGRWSCGGA